MRNCDYLQALTRNSEHDTVWKSPERKPATATTHDLANLRRAAEKGHDTTYFVADKDAKPAHVRLARQSRLAQLPSARRDETRPSPAQLSAQLLKHLFCRDRLYRTAVQFLAAPRNLLRPSSLHVRVRRTVQVLEQRAKQSLLVEHVERPNFRLNLSNVACHGVETTLARLGRQIGNVGDS